MVTKTLLLACTLGSALAVNFGFEEIQLSEVETRNYSSIRFADTATTPEKQECRYIPGDEQWPSEEEWTRFNETLGGALLKPRPLAVVCYNGPQYNPTRCESLKRAWSSMELHSNDPISVMSQWSSGSSCVTTSNPNSTCSQGGYPVYVVDARNVRHVQMAVNFARNRNIRLTIKNSGHDFNGKSIGGNALGIWVHNLKGSQFHTNYTTPSYSGRALAYAGGFQSQEVTAVASRNNCTIITAGGPTVGIAGGFLQAGGHSSYTSYYGLAADHVLKIQGGAVVASGEFVTVSETENTDLFWALRGGGGGTFGVITSVVVKAFPQTPLQRGSIVFSTLPPTGSNETGISLDTFWEGMRLHWAFGKKIVDAGGLGYNFIRHVRRGDIRGLEYTTSISMPNYSAAQYRALVLPHLEELNAIGIPVPIPSSLRSRRSLSFNPTEFHTTHHRRAPHLQPRALGDVTGNTLIASRLFNTANWASPSALDALNTAIRTMVDADKGNYTFHGMNYSPTLAVSGFPNNAVNPAFRTTMMHAQAYEADAWWDTLAPVRSISEQKKRHDRLQSYMEVWKKITPGGGSYMNEGDMQEPEWKQAFYGGNYERLVQVKRKWDRWGLFWVISGVGSDEWVVRGSRGGGREGVFTQDGRLCRVV
ncbi:FAD-binding domain-containing protein [Sporormia fimetaria CBS 119925]|uniref:FAD-binding domain-containing protein n=1 Tax=Sporormia fimetaria CBS 119925 TaxID=1340428 RepID=A0A6A6VDN2_9PLEO|nr:FAD-binding domain-containing protein [Sporormia fimetaria CBS 119925]